MQLGDKIKKVTEAVGLEPCEGCKKRAEVLNAWSRRGFMGSLALGLFIFRDKTLLNAWRLLGMEPPIGAMSAIGFMRSVGAAAQWFLDTHGKFPGRQEVLDAVEQHRHHFPPNHPGYVWMSKFNAQVEEVLPGWKFDHAAKGSGFRMILRGTDYTFALDEKFVLHQAQNGPYGPPASDLPSAGEFPGAVPYDQFRPQLSLWDKFKNFLTPTVYASCNCALNPCVCKWTDCFNLCLGCTDCIVTCCTGCWNTTPTRCYCGVFCTGCTWEVGGCSTSDCGCCAWWLQTCCYTSQCAGGCLPCF